MSNLSAKKVKISSKNKSICAENKDLLSFIKKKRVPVLNTESVEVDKENISESPVMRRRKEVINYTEVVEDEPYEHTKCKEDDSEESKKVSSEAPLVKKLGRPKKVKDVEDIDNEGATTESHSVGKRGRPKKYVECESIKDSKAEAHKGGKSLQTSETVEVKKRGRPKKVQNLEKPETTAVKKKGRPIKDKDVEDMKTEEAEPESPMVRRNGRPHNYTEDEDEEDPSKDKGSEDNTQPEVKTPKSDSGGCSDLPPGWKRSSSIRTCGIVDYYIMTDAGQELR